MLFKTSAPVTGWWVGSIPMHFRLICFWWPLPLFVRFIWLIFTPREYEEMHELVKGGKG